MAGSAESVEQVWLLGRVVTVCWLGGRLCSAGRAVSWRLNTCKREGEKAPQD